MTFLDALLSEGPTTPIWSSQVCAAITSQTRAGRRVSAGIVAQLIGYAASLDDVNLNAAVVAAAASAEDDVAPMLIGACGGPSPRFRLPTGTLAHLLTMNVPSSVVAQLASDWFADDQIRSVTARRGLVAWSSPLIDLSSALMLSAYGAATTPIGLALPALAARLHSNPADAKNLKDMTNRDPETVAGLLF